MEERFKKLDYMGKKKIGIYSKDQIILSCLKQIFIRSNSEGIDILMDLDNAEESYEKIFILGMEEKEFEGRKKENFIFVKKAGDLFQNYSERTEGNINYLNFCIALGKLIDILNNIPLERKVNLMNLAISLAKSLNFSREKINTLKLAISLMDLKMQILNYYDSLEPYKTKDTSPSKVQSLLYEFFREIPKEVIDTLFPIEKGNNEISKIIEVCKLYLECKDIEILRKEGKELDGFIVEKLISILEKKKVNLGKKIVLVDGDSDSSFIKLRIENEGFEVFWFENSQKALSSLEEIKPDLILSNLIVSGYDGFTFLDKIKSMEKFKDVPFIFISSKSDSFNIKKGLSLGAIDFISKPFDVEILVTKINKYLNLEQKIDFSKRVPLREFPEEKKEEFSYEKLKEGYIIANRFQLLKEISEGGMGRIFIAKDLELREEIVLKFLKKNLIEDKKMLEKFKEEVRITRKLSHPNIVKIYDFWEVDELKFITQEYIEGRSLREILSKSGPPPVPVGLKFAKFLARAFAYSHSLGVLHMDIKPDNVLITNTNEVKVLDFGIAKIFEESSFKRVTSESTGMFGTPEYMSPEQLASRKIDERSDIYSLGVLFYELFTGELPFKASSKISIALKHIQEAPVPPTNKNPKIPLELEKIILKMLEKQKEARYSKMEEVLRELERISLWKT